MSDKQKTRANPVLRPVESVYVAFPLGQGPGPGGGQVAFRAKEDVARWALLQGRDYVRLEVPVAGRVGGGERRVYVHSYENGERVASSSLLPAKAMACACPAYCFGRGCACPELRCTSTEELALVGRDRGGRPGDRLRAFIAGLEKIGACGESVVTLPSAVAPTVGAFAAIVDALRRQGVDAAVQSVSSYFAVHLNPLAARRAG